ncbi:MAG: hypothetical protein IIW10_02625 [Spirochaetaceae bacterium]|nr:hypothetical protein [Spirochaetaceae bacterium]
MKNSIRNLKLNTYMLKGSYCNTGFDSWWHSFSGVNTETGEEKTFFVEYIVLNPSLSPDKVVFGQKEDNLLYKVNPSYLMVKAGECGKNGKELNNFYSYPDFSVNPRHLDILIGSCRMNKLTLSGSVFVNDKEAKFLPECMTDAGSMRWDLKMLKNCSYIPDNTSPWKNRVFHLSDTNIFVQGLSCEFEGTVIYDDAQYEVRRETSHGYAEKRWGKAFPKFSARFYSSDLTNMISGQKMKDSALFFWGLTGKFHGSNRKRKSFLYLKLNEKVLEFNFLKDKSSAFANVEMADNNEDENIHWVISAESKKNIVDIHIYSPKDSVSNLHHESPISAQVCEDALYSLNCHGEIKIFLKDRHQLELLDHIQFGHGGCEYFDMGN